MNDMVTIPRAEYERLIAQDEDMADGLAFERVKAAIERGEDELIPLEYVERLIAGESAVTVYRDLRGMTKAALAAASGVNRVQIVEIEAGRAKGSIATLRKLADALGVTIDDLAGRSA
jgi:DNA-binding XRE family transcriptional regulator